MKKAFLLLTVLMALLSALALSTSAATAIGEVKVPYATTAPTLDGVLSDGEWTGAKTTFSKDTAVMYERHNKNYDESKFTYTVDCYYAWDETYLYVAWEMKGSNMWFEIGNGNYIRLYLDPGAQLLAFSEAQQDDAKGAMFRAVAAVKSNATGTFGLQSLGISNIAYTVGDGNCGLTLTDNGWIYENRIAWTDMAKSVAAKTGNADATVTPAAGYTLRAQYDSLHVIEAGKTQCFLTTSMVQDAAKDIWHFSKNAAISLVLQAEAQEEVPSDPETPGDDTNPETGMNVVAPVVICAVAAAACVALTKKKH